MSYTKNLNKFLADQTVLYMKLHNLHWYIEGNSFFTLHAEFEKMYDQTHEVIDVVAERLLMLGEKPVASLKGALALSTISELEDVAICGTNSVKTVLADFKTLAADSKTIVTQAQEAGDDVTADIFTGYLSGYQKLVWMLEAYLKS